MWKLSIQKALVKFIQELHALWNLENELIIDWLKYPPSSLVLLRVKSQYILGDSFPISLACIGVLIIHRLESFTHSPPLILIKS